MTKKCLYCGKEFETEGSDIVCKKFCCRSCSDKHRRRLAKPYLRVLLKCKECGRGFYPKYGYEHRTIFCCKKCKNIHTTKRLGREHIAKNKSIYDAKVKNDPVLHSMNLSEKRHRSRQPNERYHAYRRSAVKRNISFEISFDYFLSFWDKPCHYCGSKIDGVGVDRIDSSIGYNINNCVPCCKTCNYMKRSMSVSDFLSHIQKIINHTSEVSSLDSDEHRVKK